MTRRPDDLALRYPRPPPMMAFRPGAPPPTRLTERQIEVARLVADGLSNKQIGAALHCSPRTVQQHVAAIGLRLPGSGGTRVRIALWVARHLHDEHAREAA